MAFNDSFGGNNNNNNNRRNDRPSLYSEYKFANPDSVVDATALRFSYWSGTLKVGIYPKKNTGNDEISFDMENGITVYLNHNKARMMYGIIQDYLRNPEEFDLGRGVPSGKQILTISNGKEFGVNTPCLVARKVGDDGTVQSSFSYHFRNNYHFSVADYEESGSFTKVYEPYNTLELEQFAIVLKTYYEAMTGAAAYSVVDALRYEHGRTMTRLDAIANKLGVEFGSRNNNGGRRYNSGNSYFNSNPGNGNSSSTGGGFNHTTLDEYEED